jgi:hypothetical protein
VDPYLHSVAHTPSPYLVLECEQGQDRTAGGIRSLTAVLECEEGGRIGQQEGSGDSWLSWSVNRGQERTAGGIRSLMAVLECEQGQDRTAGGIRSLMAVLECEQGAGQDSRRDQEPHGCPGV